MKPNVRESMYVFATKGNITVIRFARNAALANEVAKDMTEWAGDGVRVFAIHTSEVAA